MKRCDMSLLNLPSLVAACLVLHNICIVHKDSFCNSWLDEATNKLTGELPLEPCMADLRQVQAANAARNALFEINKVRSGAQATKPANGNDVGNTEDGDRSEFTMSGYKEGKACIVALAKRLLEGRR